MFRLTRIPIAPVRREPVRLPITVTVGVPDDECVARVAHVFNVPGAIHYLMGSAGWERSSKVIAPRVWAPGWTDKALAEFVTRPFPNSKRPFPAHAVPGLRAWELLPTLATGSNEPQSSREIVYLLASFDLRRRHEPNLRLGRTAASPDTADKGSVGFGPFRDALIAGNTRLLILQVVDPSASAALTFGQQIVGSGGPPTLVVCGGTPDGLDGYFTDVYANIVHNQPLSRAVRIRRARNSPDVHFIVGKQGDDVLQFHRWLDDIASVFDRVTTADQHLIWEIAGPNLKLMHAGQIEHLKRLIRTRVLDDASREFLSDIQRLNDIRGKIDWAREGTGVVPLSELSEAAPALEEVARHLSDAAATYSEVFDELRREATALVGAAPRVLNANFADPRRRRVLAPDAPLARGRRYELLVDVGPRWNAILSLVRGNSAFPEAALPPARKGHTLRVVFFSDHFAAPSPAPGESAKRRGPLRVLGSDDGFDRVAMRPLSTRAPDPIPAHFEHPVASAKIWLPLNAGRSRPIVGNTPGKGPGPVRLPVLLPRTRKGRGAAGVARGRLSVYYENNLLQSAVVAVAVAGNGRRRGVAEANTITVDYVLSGSFSNVDQYATRLLGPQHDPASSYPIGLSIALNDDGAGGHRLMIADRKDLTVSRPYDPRASEKLLERGREKLKECFWQRDGDCRLTGSERTWKSGLDDGNGKTLAQFKCDLWQLAWNGSDLYSRAFGQLSTPRLVPYLEKLRAGLASRTVIQVARTGLAQYVYPWAMVYDIPLPDRTIAGRLKWCKVIDEEWGEGGRRTAALSAKCPYEGVAGHSENVLCPYGFWGLKHFIEQPINVESSSPQPGQGVPLSADVLQEVRWGDPPAVAVGVTRDAELDGASLRAHLDAVRKVGSFVPVEGAARWDEVKTMLAAPDLVYFLCHGELDEEQDAPYIGIGERDGDYQHRVYPDQLLQWARTQIGFWDGRHPLVFINGCHTANLAPGQILNFVTTFANFGASCVIGTEISVRLPVATEVAERLLQRIAAGEAVGGAMHAVRWELANKGNLLGLAYTPYGLSSLTFRTTLNDAPQRGGGIGGLR